MWVVRDSMTSPQKIKRAVALAKKYRFNTLFVQVRGRGDAFYNSQWEPRSEELSGTPSRFDPLAVAIAEGHKAGLEVHAWMNTLFVWHKPRRPYSSLHVVNQHPNWLVQDKNGRRTLTEKKDAEGAFLDPAIPGVREHIRKVFLDVALRYDVDGIHFDYVRFPSSDYSFSRYDMTQFRAWLLPQIGENDAAYADKKVAGGSRLAWYYCFPEHWRAWRRGLVTETVRGVSEEAHRIKPNLIVSAAVFPSYGTAARDKGQAWHEWLQTGLLDAACPMTYNKATSLVGAQIKDAVAHSSGRPIIGGVGAWQMPATSAIAKARLYRQVGARGINFFSYDGITREGRTEAYLARIGQTLFDTPAPRPNWHRNVAAAVEIPATTNTSTEPTETPNEQLPDSSGN